MTLKCNYCFSKLNWSREIHDQKIGYYKISMFKNRKKNNAKKYQSLAWRIPWIEEPDGLPSMGSQGVTHDWATNVRTHCHYWFGASKVLDCYNWLVLKYMLQAYISYEKIAYLPILTNYVASLVFLICRSRIIRMSTSWG